MTSHFVFPRWPIVATRPSSAERPAPSGRDLVYKLLLCLRYLRTRYLAFVCIVSVMLGVATLIVVNSVMSGFSNKLKDRLHGILSDVRVETDRADGFDEPPEALERKILSSPVGEHVEAMSPNIETFALIQYTVRDRFGRKIPITKQVRLVGIDPAKQARVGGFSEYLVRQKHNPNPSFALTSDARRRFEQNVSLDRDDAFQWPQIPQVPPPAGDKLGGFLPNPVITPNPANAAPVLPPPVLAPDAAPRLPGAFLGYSMAHFHYTDPETGIAEERAILMPGDEVFIATVGASGTKPVSATFVVADFFKSEMSEYDSSFVYVPLEDLQRIRGMDDRVNAVQIKLKPGVRNDGRFVHDKFVPAVQELMPKPESLVQSWQQQQGTLLVAIDMERGILNVLLFLIIGVAGFGVLAIFSMIVSEKYRDIGVMKSLGASSSGIMGIFLSYGLLLGVVGCVLGTVAGLLFTHNINEIEAALSKATGQQIFDRKIYYFDQIPTNVETLSVVLVNFGALATCVMSSILPAFRAARLHPVQALRFE